jgi:Glyoxalase/Bleomycin resistance protein/Dioxygenase superfamily
MSDLRLPPFRHLHTAYVTHDLELGQRRLTSLFGAEDFTVYSEMGVSIPGGGEARFTFALTTVNGISLEVIQPLGGEDNVYRQALPDDTADIALHHFASAIHDEGEWDMLMNAVRSQAIEVLVQGGEEYNLHYIYLDTRRQLGHILEFIWQ